MKFENESVVKTHLYQVTWAFKKCKSLCKLFPWNPAPHQLSLGTSMLAAAQVFAGKILWNLPCSVLSMLLSKALPQMWLWPAPANPSPSLFEAGTELTPCARWPTGTGQRWQDTLWVEMDSCVCLNREAGPLSLHCVATHWRLASQPRRCQAPGGAFRDRPRPAGILSLVSDRMAGPKAEGFAYWSAAFLGSAKSQ